MKSRYLTAKEVAGIVERTSRHVRDSDYQRRLGLDQCRDQSSKHIRFRRREAMQALREHGIETDGLE